MDYDIGNGHGGIHMLKELKWSAILTSVGYIAAGVVLVLYPELSANVICYVFGIASCVFGVVSLTTYFLLNIKDSLFRNEFVIGIMAIIAGILMITKRDLLLELVPIFLGLVIITSGFTKLQRAVVAYRIGYDKALVYSLLALISIVFGIVIMFVLSGRQAQDVLFITIGAGLIYCGLSDLIITLFLARKFHQFVTAFESGTAVKPAAAPVIEAESQLSMEQPPEEDVNITDSPDTFG